MNDGWSWQLSGTCKVDDELRKLELRGSMIFELLRFDG